ncbi:MAG TPA: hypothetical protein EYM36_11450 [Acidobacteria bacterium]|nr:hypothetical protein [Acidobacteriota bacterium]
MTSRSCACIESVLIPGDYDQDGRTDLGVYRQGAGVPDPGVWYVLQGGTGFTTAFSATLAPFSATPATLFPVF